MELNDTTDYQRCFVCGLQNPYGLHMVFRREGDIIVSEVQPREEHQGFPGVIHGGIVASILDEALNRTSMLSKHPAWTMTGRLEVRYRRYVPYGVLLHVRARLTGERGRMVQASGELLLADDDKIVLAEAQGTFMALSRETIATIMQEYPSMRGLFEQ